MKALVLTICLFMAINGFCQFGETPAFNKAINLTMTYNTHSNSSASINFGIQGNRLPISVMVGGNYMELADKVTWGYNAMAMLRVCQVGEDHFVNLNTYSTIYRQSGKFLYEYGGKVGILFNDKSIVYFSAGYTFDRKSTGKTELGGTEQYKAITGGASFSLLF